MTNLLWFSLGSTVAIPLCVIVYLQWKQSAALLNRLLERHGIVPLSEEKRGEVETPPLPQRKVSYKVETPRVGYTPTKKT